MGLLNPLLLGLAAAAAVPLLLHLLQRHHGPRIEFPALRYLRRAEKESARRIRVRQLLLMLLRVAAVLLLALAAARPFLRAAGEGHAPTAVVIVLDNSLSTSLVDGDVRVLDDLRDRALEILAAAGPDDRFWLIRAGEPDEPALTGDATVTAMRLREVRPAAAHADLPAALERARALLAAGADGRAAEIHLLTDLQASSFHAVTAAPGDAPPVIVYHPGTPAPANRAITNVEVGGGLTPIAGQRTTVTAETSGDEDEVTVRLVVEERLVAATNTTSGASAVLSLPPVPAGVLAGRVEIDADALSADDVRYFAVMVAPPPAVAVSGTQPFLADALEVLADASRVARSSMASADVALLEAGLGVETVPAGASVIILPPSQPVQAEAVNRRLAAAGIPWRFDAPQTGEARFAVPTDDPLLRSLEGVRIRLSYPVVPTTGTATDSVLLRLADGTPWAVRGERAAGGVWILVGSPLTPEASTLPVGVAMLPLLERLTGSWAMARPTGTDVAPGTVVTVPGPADGMLLPDGTRMGVTAGATVPIGIDPGVYRLVRGDSVVMAYAVNAPPAASDLTRLDRRGLAESLPGWTLHGTTDADAYRRASFRERLGTEVWRPLLLALLVVLLLESIIAASGRTRRSAAPVAEAHTT
ncbi:MAG TPA: BatA domain-containing protein [Longimicrobiales bacterium]|nr:BatA domain-containing protein [Longimicrobiales bacterium]